MRTTLTLDEDVAQGLKRMQKRFPDKPMKEIVNQLLKSGLAANGDEVRVAFKIKANTKSKPKPGLDFDCINSLISKVEGDFHK